MKRSFNYFAGVPVFIVLILSFFVISCSNPTSSDDDDHEHEEAAGYRLLLNGATVVEQQPGEDPTGEIKLVPGEETDLITIFFISEDGDEFQPEEDEYSLGYEFDEDGVVEFEQHSEDGKWSFHLHAETEGTTNMRIMLMHSGHSDFTSRDILVQVEGAD